MPQPERILLPRETCFAGAGQVTRELLEFRVALFVFERRFKFELPVEVVLDNALVASRHENKVLNAGFARFVDHVLDERPVDDCQHFLRHGFSSRKEARAEARDRENGFADARHGSLG